MPLPPRDPAAEARRKAERTRALAAAAAKAKRDRKAATKKRAAAKLATGPADSIDKDAMEQIALLDACDDSAESLAAHLKNRDAAERQYRHDVPEAGPNADGKAKARARTTRAKPDGLPRGVEEHAAGGAAFYGMVSPSRYRDSVERQTLVAAFRDLRSVSVPLWAVRIGGSTAESLLLARLAYWAQPGRDGMPRGRRRRRDPATGQVYVWTSKDDQAMSEETGLAIPTIKKARKRLVDRGLLRTRRSNDQVERNGHKEVAVVCFYRLDWHALDRAYLRAGGDYYRHLGRTPEYVEREDSAGPDDAARVAARN